MKQIIYPVLFVHFQSLLKISSVIHLHKYLFPCILKWKIIIHYTSNKHTTSLCVSVLKSGHFQDFIRAHICGNIFMLIFFNIFVVILVLHTYINNISVTTLHHQKKVTQPQPRNYCALTIFYLILVGTILYKMIWNVLFMLSVWFLVECISIMAIMFIFIFYL